MAAAHDIHQKQRAVIEFVVCENETVGNIHKRLQKVYGNDAVDRSTVGRWAKQLFGKVDMAISMTYRAVVGRSQHTQTPLLRERTT
jgi:hypothetical protein